MRFKNNFTMVPFRNENPSHHSWLLSLREPTVSKDPFGYSSLVHLCCRAQCFFGFLCCTIQGNETKVQMGFTGVYEERPVIPRCWGSVRQAAREHSMKNWGIIPLVPLQLSFLPQTLPWCPRQTRHCLHPLLILSTSSLVSPTWSPRRGPQTPPPGQSLLLHVFTV